jgi:hypothetical protein
LEFIFLGFFIFFEALKLIDNFGKSLKIQILLSLTHCLGNVKSLAHVSGELASETAIFVIFPNIVLFLPFLILKLLFKKNLIVFF